MLVAGQRSAQVARKIFHILSISFIWNHISWVGAHDKKRQTEKVWQASVTGKLSSLCQWLSLDCLSLHVIGSLLEKEISCYCFFLSKRKRRLDHKVNRLFRWKNEKYGDAGPTLHPQWGKAVASACEGGSYHSWLCGADRERHCVTGLNTPPITPIPRTAPRRLASRCYTR